MNNRNWIAIFLGLACLVLFVGVFSASGNWMNNNNTTRNNGTTPQQISQTIRNMDTNKSPDGTLPTEIDASEIVNTNDQNQGTNNQNTQNQQSSNILNMPSMILPNMPQ